LTSLAYLWRRDQRELLAEMIACNLKAIIIKVAALGILFINEMFIEFLIKAVPDRGKLLFG